MGAIIVAMPKHDDSDRIADIIKHSDIWEEVFICDTGSEVLRKIEDMDISLVVCTRKLRDMGGVPVLAHPIQMKLNEQELYQTVKELKRNGLLGLEVYHPDQQSDYAPYRSLTEKEDLLQTGGSDYHGKNKDIALGCTSDAWPDAQKNINRILELLNR